MTTQTPVQTLTEKKCKPCTSGAPALKGLALREYMQQLQGWELLEEAMLGRTFRFPDFAKALEFTNRVGQLAESEGHHPDIHLGWGKVRVELTTHKVNGLSENDFILAAKINQIGT